MKYTIQEERQWRIIALDNVLMEYKKQIPSFLALYE